MRKIKLGFCGFWGSFNPQKNMFVNILKKYFDVEICDLSRGDKPDFLLCSNRGKPFEYAQYDCVRIMYMGENLSPDFTAFDYVIGFDNIAFGDRYFRLPFVFYSDEPFKERSITEEKAKEILAEKKYFCNFIYGHQSSHGMREALFEKLNTYKHVISPGRFMNNVSGGGGCSWTEKHQFLLESKFTIAGDSISYPGFVTEKILDPLRFFSVPVYFGNPQISRDFNPEAFIECKSSDDLDDVLERVIKIDSDDKAYIDMLRAPMFCKEHYLDDMYEKFEDFLVNIFEQTPKEARRRIQFFCAENHNAALKEYYQIYSHTPEVVRKIVSKIKK